MASDFEKPDKVHTLYISEIQEKLWPLPIGDLFGCGRKTEPELRKM
jgi:DNA polymerase-4